MDDLTIVLLPALAMGLGWGIRGQFGHETGAMVPGALVGLALAVVGSRELSPPDALRLAAVGALACFLGGVMTYGQTVGLVHDKPGSGSFGWGLLGVAIKGAVWIGLTGAFLGMAGSGLAYSPTEIALLGLGCTILAAAGVRLLNRPHDPPAALPNVYFSKRDDPKPRPEFWGGLWLALAGLLLYLLLVKSDRFAAGMACWGILGGAVGFAGGEWLQTWGSHRRPFGERAQAWIDWWKVMEVSFGLLAGAALGLGWYLLEPGTRAVAAPPSHLGASLELVVLVPWTAWLVAAETGWRPANAVWGLSFAVIALPMAAVFGGTLWPAFVVLPLLLLVSGDNVVREWSREARRASPLGLWTGLVALAVLACGAAWAGVALAWPPCAWLVLTVWLQTGLTVAWALGTGSVAAASGLREKLLAMRSGLTVEAVLVAMAALITALSCW